MNYNEFTTGILINCLPENKPLVKDSGLWTIYNEKFETPIFEQKSNESLKKFLIRYYEFLSKTENMKKVHIDLTSAKRESEIKELDNWEDAGLYASNLYDLPLAVNTKGLKFKFYAEFLTGAAWMLNRIKTKL